MAENPAPPDAAPAAKSSGNKGPLIIALVNTIAILGAMGMFAYTRILHQRPPITERDERAKLKALTEAPAKAAVEPGWVSFEPLTVNVAANPSEPSEAPGTDSQIGGKLHYVQMGFSLQIRDAEEAPRFENVRTQFLDRLLALMGKKTFEELNTVQGRYILRTEIVEVANKLVGEPIVMQAFLSTFIIQ